MNFSNKVKLQNLIALHKYVLLHQIFLEYSAAPTPEVDQYVSPREIHDIPKAAPRKATNSRKRKTTRILTATPVRDSIAILKTKLRKNFLVKKKQQSW